MPGITPEPRAAVAVSRATALGRALNPWNSGLVGRDDSLVAIVPVDTRGVRTVRERGLVGRVEVLDSEDDRALAPAMSMILRPSVVILGVLTGCVTVAVARETGAEPMERVAGGRETTACFGTVRSTVGLGRGAVLIAGIVAARVGRGLADLTETGGEDLGAGVNVGRAGDGEVLTGVCDFSPFAFSRIVLPSRERAAPQTLACGTKRVAPARVTKSPVALACPCPLAAPAAPKTSISTTALAANNLFIFGPS